MTSPQQKHCPVGIDLGTTYSAVAYLDEMGAPKTLTNSWGDLLTPSAVSFDDQEVIVGKEALKLALVQPDVCADCFKRDVGRHEFRRSIRNQTVPPEVLSAFLLEALKRDAEQRLGPIQDVVITVPAFFDEMRRKATQEAGRLAGLNVLDIINEPTAAALAFGYRQGTFGDGASSAHRILVYDLGGGTFDVTILEIAGSAFRTLATDGDVQLGGKDFDERVVNHIAAQFVAAYGLDPRSDLHDTAQLWQDVQEAKHALSQRTKTNIVVLHQGKRLRVELTREEFEELTRDLLERTETTTALVLGQAKLTWPDIDRVLLVGGSSRIPMVREMLRRVSGHELDSSLSPDEAVAHGAALYAGILTEERGGQRSCTLVNVNSHSLGVVGTSLTTQQKTNVILIPKNSPLPIRASRSFRTARTDQRTIKVEVVEGESQRPEQCIALGECTVRDLPPGLAQGTPVVVEFEYSSNGRLSVAGARSQRTTIGTNGHPIETPQKPRDAGPLAVAFAARLWRRKRSDACCRRGRLVGAEV